MHVQPELWTASLRSCYGTEKRPYQRCSDSGTPYLVGNGPKFPELPSGIVLPTQQHEFEMEQGKNVR